MGRNVAGGKEVRVNDEQLLVRRVAIKLVLQYYM